MMDSQAGQRDHENVATPVELVRMLRLLYRDLPHPDVARAVLAVLRKPNAGFIEQAVPGTIEVANKPGWTSGVRCDAGVVYLPRTPFALAIMLAYGGDRPEALDAAVVALARTTYEAMAILERSNAFGHAVFA
jgi:beta-lactamase class A